MPTIFGFENEELKAQPLFTAKRDTTATWSASHQFTCTEEDFDQVKDTLVVGGLLSDLDPTLPEPFFSILFISGFTINREEGDLYEINIEAVGNSSSQFNNDEEDLPPDVIAEYNLNASIVDVSLSEHPKYTTLSLKEQTALSNLLNGTYQYDFESDGLIQQDTAGVYHRVSDASRTITSEDGRQFARYIVNGITTYRDCGLTWTETTEGTAQLNPAQLGKLGRISIPRGNPPTPPGSRNWMLTNATQTKIAETYRTTLEWTLSARTKWDTFLYED